MEVKRNNPNVVPEYDFQQIETIPGVVPPIAIKSSNNWRTPKHLFKLVLQEFDLVVDRAADEYNHLLPFYYTKDDRVNVLDMAWNTSGWINPPYSEPGKWFRKAHQELLQRNTLSVMLVKVATSENYWVETVRDAEVRFIAGRLKFEDDLGKPHYSATFGSALLIFSPETIGKPSTYYYDYRGDKPVRLF